MSRRQMKLVFEKTRNTGNLSHEAPAHLQPYFPDHSNSRILSPRDLNLETTPKSVEQKENDFDRSHRLYSSFLSDSDSNSVVFHSKKITPEVHSPDVEQLTNVSIARFRKQIEKYRENLVTERLKNISLRNGQKSALEELKKERTNKSELEKQAQRSQDAVSQLEHQFAEQMSKKEAEYKTSLSRKVSEIAFLNQTIRTLQDSIAAHKPNRLSQMVSKLTEQVAQQSERAQRLGNDLDRREREVVEKERIASDQELKLRRLEHKLEDSAIYCQQLQKHLDTKSKTEVELRRQVENKDRIINELTAKTSAQMQRVDMQRSTQETELGQMRACFMEEQQRCARLKKQIQQIQNAAEQQAVEMLMLRNQLKEQSEIHNLQILKLTDSINHKERTHDGNVRRLYEENQRLSSDYARALEENARYQTAYVQSSAAKEELQRLKICLRSKDEQIELLQRDLLKHGQTETTRMRTISVQTPNDLDKCQVNEEDVLIVDNIQTSIKRLRELIQSYIERQEVDENLLAQLDCLPELMSPMKMTARPIDSRSARLYRETVSDIWIDTIELRRCICENMADFIGNQCVTQ